MNLIHIGKEDFMRQFFCGACGTQFSTDDKFCKNCGAENTSLIREQNSVSTQHNETNANQSKQKNNISNIIGNKNPDDIMNRSQKKTVLTPVRVRKDVRRIGLLGLLLPWGIFIILALTYSVMPTPVQEVGMVIAMIAGIVNFIRFLIGSFRFYKVYEINDDGHIIYTAFNKKGVCYAIYRAAEFTPSPLLKVHPAEELEKILETTK